MLITQLISDVKDKLFIRRFQRILNINKYEYLHYTIKRD